ncbi:endogenous retrovirus group FC1 Env polyprotein-like [Arvicanthis niloticus]|uniref:endogenous retrovirus group FC1 Env polyprotein-like n=1 Tax=Arvicanthis niloticus TaxID=61156 RepID=UPI00402B2A55
MKRGEIEQPNAADNRQHAQRGTGGMVLGLSGRAFLFALSLTDIHVRSKTGLAMHTCNLSTQQVEEDPKFKVYLYEPEELALQMGGSRKKREIFIPLLIGLGLAVSLGATGTAGAALIQTQHLAGDFQDKLDQAMASTMDSLESLQCQTTSLSGVALQNRRALDLFTAEQGVGDLCFVGGGMSLLCQ